MNNITPSFFSSSNQLSSYLSFDSDIYRLLLDKVNGDAHGERLLASLLLFEPHFEKLHPTIMSSASSFLEVLGIPLSNINTGLENVIKDYTELLKSSSWSEEEWVNGLFMFCLHFYQHHPFLAPHVLQQRANDQYTHFSCIHKQANPLALLWIKKWLDGYHSQEARQTICIELAFDAINLLSVSCRLPEPIRSTRKGEIALIKLWLRWISQGINLSAYQFVSSILANPPHPFPTFSLPVSPMSTDHRTGSHTIHYALFGALVKNHVGQVLHQPMNIFIPENKINSSLFQVKKYRIILNLIQQALQVNLPTQPGLISVVEPTTARVIRQIYISSL